MLMVRMVRMMRTARMMGASLSLTLALPGLAPCAQASAAISVTDDAQHRITLGKPAQRIVSLAPHATELIYAAGAGDKLIAVSDYSDYPEAATHLPSVGSVFALDTERLLALKPDLVVIWGTGNGKNLAQKLRDQHIAVFESEPKNYETIATSLERLGKLAGKESEAGDAARRFRERLQKLRAAYASKDVPVGVFYQVSNKPVMTLNGTHMVSDAIRLCGGSNVFGALTPISPTISTEAVLAANPDAIITGGNDTGSLQMWQAYPVIKAVKAKHLYAVPADWLNRAGPRILDGTEALCKAIRSARNS